MPRCVVLPRHIGTNAAGMSPQGRPKGEYSSPQGEGTLMSPQGRPKGEYRNAQHAGCLISPAGGGKPPATL